jgi:hypothetical protein
MRRHHCIGSIDLWIEEGWFVDTTLQMVRNNEARAALKKLEHPHMRADPVRQRLGPGRLRVGVAGGAEHRDEDLDLADFAGRKIDDAELLARVVNKHLVAGDVRLAHHRRETLLKFPKQIVESADMFAITYQPLCYGRIYVARAALRRWEPQAAVVFDAT